MQTKNLFALATLTMILTGAAFGQWHPDIDKVKVRKGKATQVQPGQNSGGTISHQRRKPAMPKAHDKYANQEVSYRQAKSTDVAIESLEKSKGAQRQAPTAVFEPNNEPLWVNQKNRQKQLRNKAKNQDIEVENDETHRTQPRATRTETVDNNETITIHQKPHAKNQTNRRKAANIKFDGIDGEIKGKQPNAAKYDGIDGESNDARTRNPNQPGKAQNLLPYLEQSNIYKNKPRRRYVNPRAKTAPPGN